MTDKAASATTHAALSAVDGALALAFAAACLAVFAALGQGILYGDGAEFMLLLQQGSAGHKNHLAYLPLLRASACVGEAIGWSPFFSARMLSHVGAALGVGIFYLVSRRVGLARADAAWITALIGSAPSVIFFATVVEVHAPYFCFVALAWLAAAHLSRAPSIGRGALLGVACGAAYFGHASGLILPAPLLLWVAHVRGNGRELLRPALACLLAHTALATLVPLALSHVGHVASPVAAARFLGWWKIEVLEHPGAALLVLWDEWLLAYLPISILWLRAFFVERRSACLALIALLPYLALSIALLAVYREFGAYQHAVVWLIAWLTVRTWRWPVRLAAVVIGLGIAGWRVNLSDDPARVTAYATGLAKVTGVAEPLLIIAGLADYEHCFIARPETAFENLADPRYADATTVVAAAVSLDSAIDAHRRRGGRVFLTAGAIDLLGRSAQRAPESGFATLFAHLQARYQTHAVAANPFSAVELSSRE